MQNEKTAIDVSGGKSVEMGIRKDTEHHKSIDEAEEIETVRLNKYIKNLGHSKKRQAMLGDNRKTELCFEGL